MCGYDMRWEEVSESERIEYKAASALFSEACKKRDALPKEEIGEFDTEKYRASSGLDFEDNSLYTGRSERYKNAQALVSQLYKEMEDTEQSYFRLNVWGMSHYRSVMFDIGMVFDDIPYPDWPRPEDYGLSYEDTPEAIYPEDYPEKYNLLSDSAKAQGVEFRSRGEEIRSWHGKADTPGIPVHKFSTNDGWHVLPAEAVAAVRMWELFAEGHETPQKALSTVWGAPLEDGAYAYWLKWILYLSRSAEHKGFRVR